jgi:hypothetical protein
MLYARYPERFNILGQIKWRGSIPGLLRTVPGGSRRMVLWGASKIATPTVFDPALTLMRFLPQTMEWTIGWAMAALVCAALGIATIPALAMLALGPIWALHYAWHAPIEKSHISFKARMLVAYLAYVGPMVRTITRYKTLSKAQKNEILDAIRQRPTVQWMKRTVRLAYWNESWTPRDALLEKLTKLLDKNRCPAAIESGWKDYDLEIRSNPFARVELKTADEEHEQGKLKNHIAARVRMSTSSRIGLAAGVTGTIVTVIIGMPLLAAGFAGLTVVFAACVTAAMIESGRMTYRAVEECAAELNLIPLGAPVRPTAPAIESAPAAMPIKPVTAAEMVVVQTPTATE